MCKPHCEEVFVRGGWLSPLATGGDVRPDYKVNTVTLKFTATDVSGNELVSPVAVPEGSRFWINCALILTSELIWPYAIISIKNNTNDGWNAQVACRFPMDSDVDITAANVLYSDYILLSADNTTCVSGLLIIELIAKNLPKYYQCKWADTEHQNITVEMILRTYINPTQPHIEQIPWYKPTEGSKVEYRCESNGRPPPILRFTYDGEEIPESELTHFPSPDSITVDSNRITSTVTWNSVANKTMIGKILKCEIYNHLSNSTLFQELQLPTDHKAAAGGLKPGIIAVIATAGLLAMISL